MPGVSAFGLGSHGILLPRKMCIAMTGGLKARR